MARDVIRHRLVLSFEALSDNITSDTILTTILGRIAAPVVPLRESSNGRLSVHA
jgi:MoxR-like ATPase